MALKEKDFELLLHRQYCDNPKCKDFRFTASKNIKIHNRRKGQVYCKSCGNIWVVTKGSIFYGLKVPMEKLVNTLALLSQGTRVVDACAALGVSAGTISALDQ